MNYYIDVRLKPDAEIREAELSSKVFTKFHKGLVKLKTDQIGISFPEAQLKLGCLYRLHGDEKTLNELQSIDWLGGLSGYCHIGTVSQIPDSCQFRLITEKRSNLKSSKLRRLIARGSIDKEGEKRYKVKMLSQGFDNPYLDLHSSSNGQVYRKFFEFGDLLSKPIAGTFDTFGLSKTATIPWF